MTTCRGIGEIASWPSRFASTLCLDDVNIWGGDSVIWKVPLNEVVNDEFATDPHTRRRSQPPHDRVA